MSAATPLVSVITIFLNEERFLTEAVESVLAQSYDAWELLLVDDGSSDGSTVIARQYAERWPERIRYVDHEGHANRGMSASRNRGLGEARGTFVTFLDADDVFLPAKLSEQVAIMLAHPDADMVYGQALIWHSWTGRADDVNRDFRYDLGVVPNQLVQPPALFHLLLENAAQSPMTGNALLRRAAVDRLGGFAESFRGMYEDQVFFFKVNLASPVFVSDACWMKYRQHPASTAARAREGGTHGYHARRRHLLEWLDDHLDQRGVARESDERCAVREQLWRARHPMLHRLRSRWHILMRRRGST